MEKCKLSLTGEFSAPELDEIIRDLATARAGMLPAIPATPEESSDALVLADPSVKIRTLVGGGVRIWIRSDGLGWFAFDVSAANREGLARFLAGEGGSTHTLH